MVQDEAVDATTQVSVRKLLKDFRELYGYGSMGMCGSDDKITGPEAIA